MIIDINKSMIATNNKLRKKGTILLMFLFTYNLYAINDDTCNTILNLAYNFTWIGNQLLPNHKTIYSDISSHSQKLWRIFLDSYKDKQYELTESDIAEIESAQYFIKKNKMIENEEKHVNKIITFVIKHKKEKGTPVYSVTLADLDSL